MICCKTVRSKRVVSRGVGLLSTCSLHWLQSRASHLSVRLPGFHLEDPPPSLWCTPSLSQPLTPPPPLALSSPPPPPRSLAPFCSLAPCEDVEESISAAQRLQPPLPLPRPPQRFSCACNAAGLCSAAGLEARRHDVLPPLCGPPCTLQSAPDTLSAEITVCLVALR